MGGRAFDSFLAERALDEVLASALGPEPSPEAIESFRGDESSWARICEAAQTGSLFAQERVVLVRRAEALKGDGTEIVAYAQAPNPAVTLILVAQSIDRRRAVWKKLHAAAEVISAEPLKGARLAGFVRSEIRRRGLAISDEGVEEIIARVGQDLRRLSGELDKLEAFVDGRKDGLDVDEVARVLGRGMAPPLFRLADAFSERQTRRALEHLEVMLDEGEEALRILATLHRALRQVRAAADPSVRALRPAEAAGQLGLPPNMAFKAGSILQAASRWSAGDLQRGTVLLAGADRRLKLGGQPKAVLSAAVVGICGGGGAKAG
jgi:DNA polymerase-3 subunit delta